jgi:DNA-binding CsgD family transcriptional regulator
MGVLLVTLEGQIIYSNAQADLSLRKADGIRSVGGRISTTNGRTTERLSGLIRTSVATAAGQEGTAGGAVSVPRSGRLPLSLLVAPFRPARNGFGLPFPSALVFIRDPEGATPATSALQSLFGLTPAEASIAAALAGGQSLEEISVAHGIRVGTARTHLKSILAKTGTNRQAQLVTLLLHSVAVL